MAHLEAGVVHRGDDRAGPVELAVREDVAADEPRRPRAVACVGPGDAVVEQPPARPQPAAQEREVRRQVGHADVLGEPDRADRVEAAPRARRGSPGGGPRPGRDSPALAIAFWRPLGLLARQRHAERLDAVVLRRRA